MALNQKVDENKSSLQFNFTKHIVQYVDCRMGLWTGSIFDFVQLPSKHNNIYTTHYIQYTLYTLLTPLFDLKPSNPLKWTLNLLNLFYSTVFNSHLKAQTILSLKLLQEVTSMAIKNSLKSRKPLLSF